MIYPITRRTLFPVVRFFIKKTEGLENLPSSGPFIIACKHLGPLDGLFIAAVIIPYLRRKISYVANIARWGWLWEKVVGEWWSNSIPFYKENPKLCLAIASEYLKQGKIVGIFPEGIIQDYLANKGENRIKTGVSRLALRSKVPIIPVGLVHDITVKKVQKLYRRRQVIKNFLLNPNSLEIHIGQPFVLSDYYNREFTKEMLREASIYVMSKIDALTEVHYKNSNINT